MKAYWESGGIVPCILWPWHYMDVSGQLHAQATLSREHNYVLTFSIFFFVCGAGEVQT